MIKNLTPTFRSFATLLGFSEQELINLEIEYKLMQRKSKLSWWQLLFASIMSLLSSENSRLKDKVVALVIYFQISISENAISDRLSQLSSEFLDRLINRLSALAKHTGSPKLRRRYMNMIKVLACDATIINLDCRTEKDFSKSKSCLKAQAKMYFLMDVFTNECIENTITSAKVVEKYVTNGSKEHDNNRTIELRDRGWFSHTFFKELVEDNRYFIMRIKKGWNPEVKAVTNGDINWIGRGFKELDVSNYDEIDIEVFLLERHGRRIKCKNGNYLSVKVKGKKIKGQMNYYCFYLNEEWDFTFNELWEIYRYRWNVEEVFKILKSCFGLSKLRVRNKMMIINTIKIILISYLISSIVVKQMSSSHNCSENAFSLFSLLSGQVRQLFLHIIEQCIAMEVELKKSDWKRLTDSLFKIMYNKKKSLSHRNRSIIHILNR